MYTRGEKRDGYRYPGAMGLEYGGKVYVQVDPVTNYPRSKWRISPRVNALSRLWLLSRAVFSSHRFINAVLFAFLSFPFWSTSTRKNCFTGRELCELFSQNFASEWEYSNKFEIKIWNKDNKRFGIDWKCWIEMKIF